MRRRWKRPDSRSSARSISAPRWSRTRRIRTGAIDIYPEYTGTGLNAVMKAQGVTDATPDKVYEMVKAHYEKEFKLTWLKPSGVNNGYAIIVRPETAQSMNLKTLSDLAKVAAS